MTFSLAPDDGYPRLWRFVGPGVLPPGVLCTLDKKLNLLVVDKEAYDQMQPLHQHQLLRTQESVVYYRLAA